MRFLFSNLAPQLLATINSTFPTQMRGINLDRLITINQNVFVLQKSPTVILVLLLTNGKLSKACPLNALGKQVAKNHISTR